MSINSLHKAKGADKDEFYTRLADIEKEISMHADVVRQFEGKVVYCNCDDPEKSAFYTFFRLQFKHLKLKKVIFTHYEPSGAPSYKLEWDGTKVEENGEFKMKNLIKTPLEGNGDFRSPECVAILDECDIVVTNPPFSLFREFIRLIVSHGKKFYVLADMNCINCKEIFPLIKENKMWAGYGFNKTMEFIMPDSYELKGKAYIDEEGKKHGFVPAISWFTNVHIDKINEELFLGERYKYHADRHPKYDNYDAIECSEIKEIPCDYDGVMGVPITFLGSYNPDQFEIIGCTQRGCHDDFPDTKKYNTYLEYRQDGTKTGSTGNKTNENANLVQNDKKHHYFMNDEGECVQSKYGRIFIRRK